MDPPAIEEKQQEDLHLSIAIAVDAKDTWGIDTARSFPRDECYLLLQVGSRSLKRMARRQSAQPPFIHSRFEASAAVTEREESGMANPDAQHRINAGART